MNEKQKYKVFKKYYLSAEERTNDMEGNWEYVGDTVAVSSAKAINNVRYRTLGNISQYKPMITSCHYDSGYEWKAIPEEKEIYDIEYIKRELVDKEIISKSKSIKTLSARVVEAKKILGIKDIGKTGNRKLYTKKDADKIVNEIANKKNTNKIENGYGINYIKNRLIESKAIEPDIDIRTLSSRISIIKDELGIKEIGKGMYNRKFYLKEDADKMIEKYIQNYKPEKNNEYYDEKIAFEYVTTLYEENKELKEIIKKYEIALKRANEKVEELEKDKSQNTGLISKILSFKNRG